MAIYSNEKEKSITLLPVTPDTLESTLLSFIEQSSTKGNFGLFRRAVTEHPVKESCFLFEIPGTFYQLPFKVCLDKSGNIDIFCVDLNQRSVNIGFKQIVEKVLSHYNKDRLNHFHDYYIVADIREKLLLATQDRSGPLSAEFQKFSMEQALEKLHEMSSAFNQKKEEVRPAGPA